MLWTVTLNPAIDHIYQLPRGSDETLLADAVWHLPAGKGLNVARALSALGARPVAVVLLGPDAVGAYRDSLHSCDVAARLLPELARTRHHVTILRPNQPTLHVRERGELAPPRAVASVAETLSECEAGDHVALCGSLPPGFPASAYADLAAPLTERGVKVWLDTAGEPLKHALAAGIYGLKVNAQEASNALGQPVSTPAEAAAAARSWRATGITVVCVTLGPHGLVLAIGDEVLHAPSPVVDPGSPVGSGDAALAALLMGWAGGSDTRSLAASAAAAGAANAYSPLPGDLSATLYRTLVAQIVPTVRTMDAL